MHGERLLPCRRIPQDKSCHARRISLDEPRHARWLHRANLAMHDGSTGRILSRSMVSIVQILPSRLGGSRWANPVGQSTLDGANGFHRRVRHCHFRECPLGGKHLNNREPRLREAQSAASPSFVGPNPPRAPIPKRPGHFSTRATMHCGTSAPKRQGRFSARHQSAQPVSTSRTKSTQAQNHQPKPPRESTEFISFFAQAL